jgi:hypothetical protein
MWKVYTRSTSASDFSGPKYHGPFKRTLYGPKSMFRISEAAVFGLEDKYHSLDIQRFNTIQNRFIKDPYNLIWSTSYSKKFNREKKPQKAGPWS